MSDTIPSKRKGRRKNSTDNLTLTDIKDLIEDKCSDIQNTMRKEIQKINDNVQQILMRMNGLEKAQEDLKLENRHLKKEIEDLKAAQENTLCQTADEMYQRSLRASNLVIFGVPESSDGTSEDRKEHDEQFCKEMLQELLRTKEDFASLHRIGKLKPDVPRPLCLKCESFEQKNRILRSSKGLRNIAQFKSVFINPDRTPMQLEKDKNLRAELKRQILAGKDVIIFREKIVERSSKINF